MVHEPKVELLTNHGRLRRWLDRTGHSERWLAREAGWGKSTANDILKRKRRPGLGKALAIEFITDGEVPALGWLPRAERLAVTQLRNKRRQPYRFITADNETAERLERFMRAVQDRSPYPGRPSVSQLRSWFPEVAIEDMEGHYPSDPRIWEALGNFQIEVARPGHEGRQWQFLPDTAPTAGEPLTVLVGRALPSLSELRRSSPRGDLRLDVGPGGSTRLLFVDRFGARDAYFLRGTRAEVLAEIQRIYECDSHRAVAIYDPLAQRHRLLERLRDQG